ncbi:universal stress protein [Streptomyces sp. NPDC058299]|uniref:universal stress protein n=1 Tax=unclassified Streptomyces TaxID=2593676 RepID=UPI0036F10ADE
MDRSAAADLVVIGARRREDHRGLQFGRVAHTLLHDTRCPVAVVPRRGCPDRWRAGRHAVRGTGSG